MGPPHKPEFEQNPESPILEYSNFLASYDSSQVFPTAVKTFTNCARQNLLFTKLIQTILTMPFKQGAYPSSDLRLITF